MPKVPFPSTNPDAWDTVNFALDAEAITLAHCQVSITADNDLDIQKPKGKNGASVVFNGRNLAKISIKALAWENVDPLSLSVFAQSNWDTLQEAISALRTFEGAFAISHPQATILGIKRVVLESIKLNAPPEGGDRYEAEITLSEFADRSVDRLVPGAAAATSVSKRLAPARAQQLAANIIPNALKPGTGP